MRLLPTITSQFAGVASFFEGKDMASYDISIDPGTNATGVCVWINGKPISSKVPSLRPPKDLEFEDKVLWLRRRLVAMFSEICGVNHQIGRIAVEQFTDQQGASDKSTVFAKKVSMMKCSTVRGMLIGLADDWCKEILHPNKRQIQKHQTGWLAEHYGVTGSKDALDAFHLGIIAGFDKKRNEV